MPEIGAILQILGPGASPAMVLAFVLLYRRDIVFGWQYDELRKDRDEWKQMALTGTSAAEKATDAAVEAVRKAKP